MTVRTIMTAAALIAAAAAMFVFVDGLQAVGRYDAGIKRVILALPYASMLMALGAVALLRRARIALILAIAALSLFLPLFVHECVPGVVSLFAPAFRSPYGDGASVPFIRFDLAGCAAGMLLVAVIVGLWTSPRRRRMTA